MSTSLGAIPIVVLKQAQEGMPGPELCRKRGFSSATFYKRRSKYEAMDSAPMARVKGPEEQNGRLNKSYADVRFQEEIAKECLHKSGDAAAMV